MISSFVRCSSPSGSDAEPGGPPPGRLDRGSWTAAGGASNAIGDPKDVGLPAAGESAALPKSIVSPPKGSAGPSLPFEPVPFDRVVLSRSSVITAQRTTRRYPQGVFSALCYRPRI